MPDTKTDNPARKSGTRRYHQRTPQFWSNASTMSETLFPIVVALDYAPTMKPCNPILILTRQPLPKINSFNTFFNGTPVTTHLVNAAPVNINPDQLRNLGLFTLRICRIIMNKPFIATLDDMLFFLAPLRLFHISADEIQATPSIPDLVSWKVVTHCATAWHVPINTDTIEQDIEDSIIQDRLTEFTRRFEVVKLRRDLTPHSFITDDSSTLFDAYKSKSNSVTNLCNDTQPIIEVSTMECHVNYLTPASHTSDSKPIVKYLIPEFCNKLTVPASTLRTALVLPSLFHRIDNLLLVKELNATMFNNVLSDELLSTAITCPSAGMEFDYERLELLGDSFLKYLSTVHIITSNGFKSESAMHTARQRMINNKALTQNAIQTALPTFVISRPFVPKRWKPPNLEVSQSSSSLLLVSNISDVEEVQTSQKEDRVHWLADKTIADVTEAVIGAAYLSGGLNTAFDAAKLLHIPLPMVSCWSDLQYKLSSLADSVPNASISSSQASMIKSAETLIGCKFERPHLLLQVLVHQNTTVSKAFVFVGDAILDFLIGRYVFDREHGLSSGGLSLLKAAMMSNSTLGTIAISSKLSEYILCAPREMMVSINTFYSKISARQKEENQRTTVDEITAGQYWQGMEPPQILVDLIKSIIGALYLSNKASSAGIEVFFGNILKPFYDKYVTLKTLAHRPTATLVELLRAHGCQSFDIKKEEIGSITRCQVYLHHRVLASGEDERPSYAVIRACHAALDSLSSALISVYCDCRAHPSKKVKESPFGHLLSMAEG
ncbi:hypothetical protein APHAL10511_001787 [Amanita phalloides]|nr:hypothetical protein APHAL10511_001787 [Amanita phalloides]